MGRFPDCFPPNFVEKILPQGLPDIELLVYRVCKNGMISKESFLSTFEETHTGKRPMPKHWEQKLLSSGTYSVSCNDRKEPAENVLKCLVGYYPAAFLMEGQASSELGPMQRTIERDATCRDSSHIDWWLYADSDPSRLFHKVEA